MAFTKAKKMLIGSRRCSNKMIEGVILMLYKILVCSYGEYFMQLTSLHLDGGKADVKR